MSAGVAQANQFYEEVAATQIVWFGCLPNEILLEFDVGDNKVSLPYGLPNLESRGLKN